MKIFVDTGPLIALLNPRDSNHGNAAEQFRKVKGTGKPAFTSDYVLDEVITYFTRKTKTPEVVATLCDLVQKSPYVHLLKVDDKTVTESKAFLEKYPELFLSLTDWTSAVLARNHAVEKIYSYDFDFDKLGAVREFEHIERVEEI